jgi:muconolactone delta-isomerase
VNEPIDPAPAHGAERDDAAARYREVTAGIAAAVEELRAKDRERALTLERRLGELDDVMARAGERTALTRFTVDLHWEAALEALWGESWMTLRTFPAPDEAADPNELDALDRQVASTFDALRDLVRRRGFGLRR